MEGRWEIDVCPEHGPTYVVPRECFWPGHDDIQPMVKVPVVPCDDAAIERAAAYLCTVSFSSLPDYGGDRKAIAEAVLRAAGETPDA